MNCITCGKETSNPKFCSNSCSARYWNRVRPKRLRTKVCSHCNAPTKAGHTFCERCTREGRHVRGGTRIEHKTISEVSRLLGSNKFRAIRDNAHKVLSPVGKKCERCPYDKHVEVCHKKAVSSFPETATIAEVNAIENLMLLCPNCHWEYDYLTS